MDEVAITLHRDQWERIVNLAGLGADYDASGCQTSYRQDAAAGDVDGVATMAAFDALRDAIRA